MTNKSHLEQTPVFKAVRQAGKMSVEEFFKLSASRYYNNKDPFGAQGDFVTAPEISQLFGEIVGLCCASCWQQLGQPGSVRFVEAGPGRATLMADMLRAGQVLQPWLSALSVHLVETSEILRTLQYNALKDVRMQTGEWKFCWHDSFADVPDGPVILVANEFLDALPVCQLVFGENGWATRCLKATDTAGKLAFVNGQAATKAEQQRINYAYKHAGTTPQNGDIFEYSPARESFVKDVAARIGRFGGVAFFIDYGYSKTAPGDSLQAVANHNFVPVTDCSAPVDITSHVDFESVARAAKSENVDVYGAIEQGQWLKRTGIEARAAQLLQTADIAQAREIASGLNRLTAAHAMGSLFKVTAYTQAGAAVPAGFTMAEKYIKN